MERARGALVFALDVNTLDEAREQGERFTGLLRWVKVGARLFCSAGPPVVDLLRAQGFQVFLDLKFHDIPDQVRGACQEAGRLGASMMTIHCCGGPAMMQAAVEGANAGAAAAGESPPTVLGVTVLTSIDTATLGLIGVPRQPLAQVEALAALARTSGLGGIVCSPREVGVLRSHHERPFVLLTPGIRPVGSSADDQARTATPAAAVADGADYLVVGRPIRTATDPAAAVEQILSQMVEGRLGG